MADAAEHGVRRAHHVLTLLMIARLGGHGPDHGQPVRLRSEPRQMLAEHHARRLRLDGLRLPLLLAARLGVERVEVAHRAPHREDDQVHPRCFRSARGRRQAAPQPVEQRHPQRGPGEAAEHGPPCDPLVEPVGRVSHSHGMPPNRAHVLRHWMNRNSRVLRSAQITLPHPVARSSADMISCTASARSSALGRRESTARKTTSIASRGAWLVTSS